MSQGAAILLIKGDALITRKFASGLTITVEESKIRKIKDLDYVLKMDKIFCINGDKYLVTEASQEKIELMMISRRKLSRQELAGFLSQVSYIERADCFEKD
jgi:uncharacterized protein YlzI (FlbEa/FlbD family)